MSLNKLIDEFDRIIRWPKKISDKDFVIKWLSEKFKYNHKYSEQDINNIINRYHSFNNIALLRRELISKKYLCRTDCGSEYWKSI